jgi:ParB-like chromosome segregation protein Spo0J
MTTPQATGLIALAERIERWPIEKLRPYERNPRTHSEAQVDQIAASMVEFGWTNPILIDENAGILAGHGRLLAARKLGLAEVPVIRFEHLSEAQKRAYLIADNTLALNAGWSEELLVQELAWLRDERFDLDLIGFDATELERLLALADGASESDEAEDDVPEPPADPSASRATSGSWATIACCAATPQCWPMSSGCSTGSLRTCASPTARTTSTTRTRPKTSSGASTGRS